MHGRLAGALALLGSLGCAGSAPPGLGAEREALAFRKEGQSCAWIRWSAAGGAHETLHPGPCPGALALSPRGDRVVMTGPRLLTVASWPGLQDRRALPLPAPLSSGDWDLLGVDGQGRAHVLGSPDAKETREGAQIKLEAGDVSLVAQAPDPQYGAHLFLHYATPVDAAAWKLLGKDIALSGDMMDVSSPHVALEDPWPELSSPASCPSSCKPPSDALAALYPESELSYLGASEGGWAFGAVDGYDGQWVAAPVFTCADSACQTRQELEDLPESITRVYPQGDYLVVEGSGPARVYQHGVARPVYTFSSEEARWLPVVGR